MKLGKIQKNFFCGLLTAGLLISSLPAFAETVVYENSFETSRGADTGLYISMPEIRTYGDNLFPIGDFERTNYVNDSTTGVRGMLANNAERVEETGIVHSGDKSAKFTTVKGDRSAYPYIEFNNAGTFGAGIYEVEAWMYTDVDGMNVDISTSQYKLADAATAFAGLSKYGTEKGTATLRANEWTYIKGTFSFAEDSAAGWGIYFIPQNGWQKSDGTMGVLYMDDVKIRKVTNAAVITDDAAQSGMPVYSTPLNQEAEVRVFAANTTAVQKSFSIITVVHNADGTLADSLDVTSFNVPANTVRKPYTANVSIPELEQGQYVKSYTWENMTSIFPLQKVRDYRRAGWLYRGEAEIGRNSNIPYTNDLGTNTPFAVQASNYATAHATDRVVSGVARTGVNSMMISSADASGATQTFTNFTVEKNHTYRIEYYVNFRNYCNGRTDCIVGYIRNDMNLNGTNITPAKTIYNGTAMAQPTEYLQHPMNQAPNSVAALIAGEWIKVEHEFTVDNDKSQWCIYFQGMSHRMLSSTYRDQMYIDDLKVVDITADTAAE